MKKPALVCICLLVFSFFFLNCSTNDDLSAGSEQFLNADINGILFNAAENSTSLYINRDYNSMGTVSLYVKSFSANGESLQFHIDNFTGEGKYLIGNRFLNQNWMSYKSNQEEDLWSIMPNTSLNDDSNFIEITYNEDEQIVGKISCSRMWSSLEQKFGPMNGNFQLDKNR